MLGVFRGVADSPAGGGNVAAGAFDRVAGRDQQGGRGGGHRLGQRLQTAIRLELLADPLARDSGRAVVVENRAGGGGRVAAEALAREAADGSVAMPAPNVVSGFFPHIYSRLPFDPLADLAPVTIR